MNNEAVEEGKTIAVISYITIFGVLIAFFMNNEKKNQFAAFHIRQSLGLWLTFFAIGLVVSNFDSWLASIAFYIFFGVLFIYGLLTALGGSTTPAPVLGAFFQKFFSGLGR
ncbi:MAG: hypothetical protein HKN00_09405 [Flavobacteriaceae bacterium]|nr:hypothetical protein [Bacteroidia bacterium]NNF75388.1 hypothetical protein [Flavobacteriaceae bacterium]NNK72464.1 hypothetical protein [Flavobacteriaceae bacterium]